MKRRKLQWYGHITRHESLAKTILQGTVEGGSTTNLLKEVRNDTILLEENYLSDKI